MTTRVIYTVGQITNKGMLKQPQKTSPPLRLFLVPSLHRKVPNHEAETAGAIMAFFLSLGLALGAGLSFLFRSLV